MLSLIYPDANLRFDESAATALEWTADPPAGTKQVVFEIDGKPIPSSSSAPWTATIDLTKLAAGAHKLTVVFDGTPEPDVWVFASGPAAASPLKTFWDHLAKASVYKNFKRDDPGDMGKLRAYAGGGPGKRPTAMATEYGWSLVCELDAYFQAGLQPLTLP